MTIMGKSQLLYSFFDIQVVIKNHRFFSYHINYGQGIYVSVQDMKLLGYMELLGFGNADVIYSFYISLTVPKFKFQREFGRFNGSEGYVEMFPCLVHYTTNISAP